MKNNFISRNKIFLSLIYIVNIFVTFYAFNQIPGNLAFDEVLLGKLALQLGKQPYTLFTPLADGHATPYFYLMLASFKLFGVNNLALRLPAALAGFISVFIFYAIAQRIWKDKRLAAIPISFITTVIFTSMRWRITFIRFSFEMPFLLLVELVSSYWLLEYVDSKKTKSLVLSALFAGLAFHSYQPGRIFFLVPLIVLVYTRLAWKKIGIYLTTVAICILPLLLFLVHNPDMDGRVNQIGYVTNSAYSVAQKTVMAVDNITKTALMFVLRGDANGRHNFPYKAALNPLLAVLFISGLIITGVQAVRAKKSRYQVFFLAYFVIALVPALLTIPSENPHMLRTYTAIPSVAYFMGAVLAQIANVKKRYVSLVTLLIIGLACAYELRTYFVFQSRVMRNSFEVVCPIEKVVYRDTKHIGDLPKSCRVHKNLF